MHNPFTNLPAPVTLEHNPSKRPLAGQQAFPLATAGYIEAKAHPAEIARRMRDGEIPVKV